MTEQEKLMVTELAWEVIYNECCEFGWGDDFPASDRDVKSTKHLFRLRLDEKLKNLR